MGFSSYMLGDCNTPGIQKNDNLIIISASGTTASLLTYAKKAKEMGAKILLVTTCSNSPIGELADAIIQISAPSPKVTNEKRYQSLLPMGTLAEQTMAIVLDSLVLYLMEKFQITSDEMFARHANLE
jgi:6-phospho-3-hexuloisomerase